MMHLYELTDKDKQDLISRLTQDVAWVDDDLVDSEQDVGHTEHDDQEEVY